MAPHAEIDVTSQSGGAAITEGHAHPAAHADKGYAGVHASNLRPAREDEVHDLVGIGFGPANLALAIALHDAIADGSVEQPPKVAFLERQETFGWHEGMLLPGTKMQISFIKDLATLRNPRSEFTFVNYLHTQKRLVSFTNLGTFLPRRVEYQDYMKWCSSWFSDVVRYGRDAGKVTPIKLDGSETVNGFSVESFNHQTQRVETLKTRRLVVGIGGRPSIPAVFPDKASTVLHSSQYARRIAKLLPDPAGEYRVAVVGGGQSAAEIFNDLHSRYPNAKTDLLVRSSALRPSDDSPFVNEIFNPERVDDFFEQPEQARAASLQQDKATNYSVVRIELLEHIYDMLYSQRISEPDERKWQHRIRSHVELAAAEPHAGKLRLMLGSNKPGASPDVKESLDADLVIVATGYHRDAHKTILADTTDLFSSPSSEGAEDSKWKVNKDYRLDYDPSKLTGDAGVWLVGCNETTHGLSDTLLSILASRGGQLVDSMFAR